MTLATIGMLLCLFATSDNNIEWNGVSHVAQEDRRPLCPINNEAFSVLFQTFAFDITSARVQVDDGGNAFWVDAVFDHDRGPYAVWRADIPATASNAVTYYIELTDGSDIDYYSISGMSDNPPTDGGFALDFATLTHAPLGATPTSDGGTVFKVWAPSPNRGFVRGEFNSWTIADEMTRVGEFFIAHVANASPGQEYKYFFRPGLIWKPDPRARALDPSQNLNAIIEDPLGYAWTTTGFTPPSFDDMIVYELHVGTFSGRNDPVASGAIPGTYRDVAAHAGDLAELGINVVELMPTTEFPTDFSAGYNPVSAYAMEWAYGTPDDFKFMVDALHGVGIALISDIVWNHVSPTDNFLWQFDGAQIYFDDPFVDTPWGAQADFDAAQVRSYYLDSVDHLLGELRLDGYRMDATSFMNVFPQDASGWSLMQAFNDKIDNRYADKIAIAEQLPDDDFVTRPTSLGGAGFDSQWYDAFNDQLRQEILDAAFGDPEMWRIRNIINGGGQYLSGRSVANYLELHDEIWPSSGGRRLVKTIDPTFPHDDIFAKGRIKLAQGLVMFAPGIPMFHQGSEWLEDTDFGGGNPSGADRIDWSKKTTYASIFQFFKDMIAVRKTNAALRASSPRDVFQVNDAANVIAFHRWDGAGNDIVVVANFSNNDYFSYSIGLPQPGRWYELLNSQASVYDGNGLGNAGFVDTSAIARNGFAQSASLTIPQMGLLVLRFNDPPATFCPTDLDRSGATDLPDLAILLANFGSASGARPQDGDIDFDGDVDLSDLSILLAEFGSACP